MTHSNWNYTVKVPTNGQILLWNHWIWIAVAYVVFGFFGLVKDARDMYRGWFEKVGIGKIDQHSHARSGRMSSLTGKAKLLWVKVGFKASMTSSSTRSSFLGAKVDSFRAGYSDVLPTTVTACEPKNDMKRKFSFRRFLASQKHSTESDVEVGLPTNDKEVA
jgi:hypothetical protein